MKKRMVSKVLLTLGLMAFIVTGFAVVASVPGYAQETMSVASIQYSSRFHGNEQKAGYTTVNIDVRIVDSTGNGVKGASVSISVCCDFGGIPWVLTDTTSRDGIAMYAIDYGGRHACWTTTVTDVTKTGYIWDGVTPANQFCF